MANKRKETSTTDFFLSVMQKEDQANKKKEEQYQPLNETKEKANSFIEKAVGIVNNLFDTIITNKASTLILSGIISVILFMMISGGNVFSSPSSGTTLEDVPLKVEGLDAKYEIEGVPESVEIGLIGPSIDLNGVTLTKNYEAFINVSNLLPGTHTVNVETRNFPDTLSVMVVPQSCQITISPKVSQQFSLGYTLINEDMMKENYSIKVNEMAVKTVTIRASQDTLQKIDRVQACIDVNDIDKDFEQDATIKAFSKNGKELKVDIAPNTVHVNCSVASAVKEVPIKAEFIGTPADNKTILNYKLSKSKVTIYGTEEELAKVNYATADIDVQDLNENTSIKGIKVKVDCDYNKISYSAINCAIELDEMTTREFSDIIIEARNLKEGFTATIDAKTNIKVSGSKQIIDSMSDDDIHAYIDAKDLNKGTYTKKVQYDVYDETLKYEILTNSKVTLVIGG